jgi:sugar lactone lactonase YvrE
MNRRLRPGVTVLAAVAAALLALAGVAGPASATPAVTLTTPVCPGVPATVSVFHPGGIPLLDWRENLAFDGLGGMWVSHLMSNEVERYDSAGRLTMTVHVASPGAIVLGRDGLLYVVFGDIPTSALDPASAGVVRFDPRAANPVPQTFVSDLAGANGLAIDAAGNLYVSNETGTGIYKVRPDGSMDAAWTASASVFGTNGLAIVGGDLYANVTFDPRSGIQRVPLADPVVHAPAAQLSLNPLTLPKGLDDLTPNGAGDLYTVAFLAGQLLRVDPATGSSCVLASGLFLPTSVRRPVAFGPYNTDADLFVTEASGPILHIHL